MGASERGPASIAEAFVGNAERSPERLCLRFEGEEISYQGMRERARELIISGGYNIYPREVEEVIEGCPGVSEVAVVGLPDQEFGERVVAVVVPEDPGLTAEKVTNSCRKALAGFKKPREVVFVDDLPRNALGKVLKHRVREGLGESEE